MAGRARKGFWRWWKLYVALIVAAILTWGEWVKHHPPAIVLIGLIHFVLVFAAIALLAQVARWFSRRSERSTLR
jgi:hypothetical protein